MLPKTEAELMVFWPVLVSLALCVWLFAAEAWRGWRTGRLRLRGGELHGAWAKFGALVLAAMASTGALLVLRGILHHLRVWP